MADFGDMAQELTETRLAHSLQKRKLLTLPFSGFCLSCEEPVGERRFCDSDCRQDYETTREKKRQGRS